MYLIHQCRGGVVEPLCQKFRKIDREVRTRAKQRCGVLQFVGSAGSHSFRGCGVWQIEKDRHFPQCRARIVNQCYSNPIAKNLDDAFDQDIKPVGLAAFGEKYRARIER